MDRFIQALNATFNTIAIPTEDQQTFAVRRVIGLTQGKTSKEQLAAFAYAWGSVKQEADNTYRQAFERYKKAFLDSAGDTLDARKQFSQIVRAGIRAQLPCDTCKQLEDVYTGCESKLEDQPGYAYKQMKAEMLAAIRALMHGQAGNSPQVKSVVAASNTAFVPPASLPSSATTATPPAYQPETTSPSVIEAPEAPPENTPVAIALPVAPLSAPLHLAFLDSFPAEWRSSPAWPKVIASMDTYFSEFKSYRGSAQSRLLAEDPAALAKVVATMQLHTALPADEAARVAYERELVNIQMNRHFDEKINAEVLGCKSSRITNSEAAQTPGNQLSISMRAPILTVDGRTCNPVILSVSAPALDTVKQPEYPHYVKDSQLDVDAYRTAFQTLASHIRQCAAVPENKGAQVVLSGFGLVNFLDSLSSQEKTKAIAIGAEVFIALIGELRADGVEVAYTDYSGSAPPWPQVSNALGSNRLQWVGSIPGKWIEDQQIIVNAWDPHALVGNGCARDDSLDGFIGRNSLVHEAHALACVLYANGFKS